MGGGYDGTIRIDSKVDTTGFNQGVKQMSGGLGPLLGIVSKIGAALAGAFIVAKLIAFGKASLMAAANLERLQGAAVKVGATFGVTAEEVTRLTQEVIDMGIQDDIAYKAFTNMARNGLDVALLPALARGAQDLNAFSDAGVSSSEVLDTLMRGILTLQTETLRTAGVIVDIGQSEAKWAKANDTTTEAMSAQEKQAAVMIAVIEQLKGVEGLYELSQRTAAGQMASNTRIMNQLMMVLGGPFQNALYIVVRTFNQFVIVLTAALKPGGQLYGLMINLASAATWVANAFRTAMQFIAGLFGLTLPDLEGVATTADEGADALGGMSDSMGDLEESTKAAGKAAKGALAPFDELNVLAKEQGGGEGGTPPGGGGGKKPVPFVPVDSGLMDQINAKLAEWKTNLAGVGVALEPIISALKRLWEASEPLRETLWTGLKWLWDNVLVPFASWVVTDFVPAFLDLLAQASITLNDALVAAQPAFDSLWKNFLKPLATWTGGAIITILDTLKDALSGISTLIKENPETFASLASVLLAVAAGLLAVAIAFGILNLALSLGPIGLVILAVAALVLGIGLLRDKFDELPEGVKSAINLVIMVINGMVRGFIGGINSMIDKLNGLKIPIPLWLQKLFNLPPTIEFAIGKMSYPAPIALFGGGSGWSGMPQMATGGVIPPNAQFAAILGDQRSGRNLEAPEALIRQIVREESGGQNVHISFEGTLGELVRQLKPVIDQEDRRIGRSLIEVGQ